MNLRPYLGIFNRSILLLFVYIFISALFMNFSDTQSLRGIRWALLQTVERVEELKQFFTIRRNLATENDLLRKENFDLNIENQKLREMLVSENKRLKKLLNLKEVGKHSYIAARVIATSAERGYRSIILDVGKVDGVGEQMAVVNADGLVGKVVIAQDDQSIVQVLMDYNANVSARLQNNRENGMIGWSGNSWLDLEYIPKNIPVAKGEVVVTSGLSDIFPPGLKIGYVLAISEEEHLLFKRIRVKPAVNFNAIEEVFVIPGYTPEKADRE